MSYNFGMPANWAANLSFHIKNGLLNVADRGAVDDAWLNNYQFFAVNPDGDGKVPFMIMVDSAGLTRFNNPEGATVYALAALQLATPAAPTITNAGTGGAVTWTYKVVAVSGSGQTLGTTPASAAGSTTTGNATLTSANYNVITFAAVTGAAEYWVYRTVAGTTPSTTGKIATVPATIDATTQLQSASYVLNDTALAGDGTTAPTVNTTGIISPGMLLGTMSIGQLSTPVGGVATVSGTSGATTITYKVVAKTALGTVTAASANITTTTANATLSSTNKVVVTWNPVPGADSYDIYRTAAGGTPSSTGKIGNVLSTASLTFSDTGIAGDSATAPSVNTTGGVRAAQSQNFVVAGGANNAITATIDGVTQVAGARLTVSLGALTLQAGGNTLALNGGSATAIKMSTAPTSDLGTAYAANGIVDLIFNGTSWLCLAQ